MKYLACAVLAVSVFALCMLGCTKSKQVPAEEMQSQVDTLSLQLGQKLHDMVVDQLHEQAIIILRDSITAIVVADCRSGFSTVGKA